MTPRRTSTRFERAIGWLCRFATVARSTKQSSMPQSVIVAWAGLALACAGADRAPEWPGTVDTLANGALLVRNTGDGAWTAETAWSLRETCRIGGAEAEGPYQFGQIVGMATDAAGRVYILDRQAQDVRVFTRDGEFVRTIGRPGQGPGEFRQANGLTFDPDGRLWVVDPGNSRYSAFDTIFNDLGMRNRPIRSYGFLSDAHFTADGELVESGLRQRGMEPGGQPDFVGILIRLDIDSATTVRDTIDLPYRPSEAFEIRRESGGRLVGMMSMLVPFSATSASVLDPRGYIWSGYNDEYRIWQLTFEGDSIRATERTVPRIAVSPAERQAEIDRITESAGEGVKQLDLGRIPNVKPFYKRFLTDDLGYLWVWRTTDSDSASFDVFDPEARFLGTLDTNARIYEYGPIDLRARTLTLVTLDDLDVPSVHCYSIVGRPAMTDSPR
jgi:hypothetical protein